MSIIDNIREAKRYREALITRLEMQGYSGLDEKSLDDLEAMEKEEGI